MLDPTTPAQPNAYPGRDRSMSTSSRQTVLSLNFLVIGGGIAGLAAATSLSRAGHNVQVLEKSSGIGEHFSGGIQVPPNMSKILVEWGLGDEMAKATERCQRTIFYQLSTGEKTGVLPWKEDVIRECGGKFLLMHHEDLLRILHNAAVAAGATVTYNTSVAAVSVDGVKTAKPHVLLANGDILTADVVVGADGHSSIVREAVDYKEDEVCDSGMTVFNMTVSAETLKTDPDLVSLCDATSDCRIWMGPSCSIKGYPLRNGSMYALHVYWPSLKVSEEAGEADETYEKIVPTSVIHSDGVNPGAQKLIKLASFASQTRHLRRNPIENWIEPFGRLVLLGDAAHPFIPCAVYAPGLAVEDGACLGALFSRLRKTDQLPYILDAYQDIRQSRTLAVSRIEADHLALFWMDPGPEQVVRDNGMRAMLDDPHCTWSESDMRSQYEELEEVFAYNAIDAAEEWFVNWGALGERTLRLNDEKASDTPEIVVEVVEVTQSIYNPIPIRP